MNLPKDFHSLAGEWGYKLEPGFTGAVVPFSRVKVDIGPFRLAEFTGANKQQRGNLERGTGGKVPRIAIQGFHKRPDFFRLGNGGVVFGWGYFEGIPQVWGNVPFNSPGGDPVAEDLAAQCFN